jgi:hypothetical protein
MSMRESRARESLAGRWHLVAADCPPGQLPNHCVDLVLYDDTAGLRGAILARHHGRELPLHVVTFDGVELRLKMGLAPGQLPSDTPFLVMVSVDDHFEGAWDVPTVERLRLKLVRAHA